MVATRSYIRNEHIIGGFWDVFWDYFLIYIVFIKRCTRVFTK